MLPSWDQAPATAELLTRIRTLELAARANAAGTLAGDYLTTFLGRGLEFHEPRRYVSGEPARSIDWNITARLDEPYVRVHREERRLEVMIALDVSPSMHTGLTAKTKLEHAVELAATLAVSAVDGGDRVGCVVFADQVLAETPPQGGRAQLFRVLSAFLAHTASWDRPVAESDPRVVLHALQRHRRRLAVFLISDFIDHDVPEDLKYVRARHDVCLLHVYDPLEYAAAPEVVFSGFSPEGSGRRSPMPVAPGETGGLEEMERFLIQEAGRHRIAVAPFPTIVPVPHALGRLFHDRRRRRRRGG